MGAKRNPQPAAVPASTVNSSLKPSTAASSQSSTQSPLRSGANKPSGSSATTTSSTTSSSTTNQRTTPATPSNAASASLKTAQANAPAPVTGKKTRGNTSSNTGAIYSLGEAQEVLQSIWTQYVRDTPQRVKLVDTFMAFLVLLGAVQFAYCVLAGNYVSITQQLLFRMTLRHVADARHVRSLSMLSFPVSAPLLGNSFSQPLSACRQIQPIKRNFPPISAMSARLPIMYSGA